MNTLKFKLLAPKWVKVFGARLKRTTWKGDCMTLVNKTVDHLEDPKFIEAHLAGASSGHGFEYFNGLDDRWKTFTAIWAARKVIKLDGDFVECGVNTGIMSLAICHYLNFQKINKQFFLFDTFCGIPEHQASSYKELEHVAIMNQMHYFDCWEQVRINFLKYQNVCLVKGEIPSSLHTVHIDKVAYLSIDMNCAYPERMAFEYFWPKMVSGGVVLVDDYGHRGMEEQRKSFDNLALKYGVPILPLPYGPAIIIKP